MSIRRARAGDLREITEACASGYFNDELFGPIMHPHRAQYPDDFASFWARKLGPRIVDPKFEVLVATDDVSGKVVGVAAWLRGGKGGEDRVGNPEYESSEEEKKEIEIHLATLPEENRACDPSKMKLLEDSHPLFIHFWTGKREEYWDLRTLCIHSEFDGKGHGKRLTTWGIDQARKEGISASVVAAYEKDGFYRKLGFVEIGSANKGALAESGVRGGAIMFIDV